MAGRKKKEEVVATVETKTEEKEPSKKELKKDLNALKAYLNKNLTSGSIKFANEVKGSALLRRPFDIPSLDIALNGGLPRGFNIVLGEKNSGKTYLMYRAASIIQKTYGSAAKIAFILVEPLDKKFAKNAGLKIAYTEEEIREFCMDYKAILGVDPTQAEIDYLKEEVGEILLARYGSGEEALQAAYELASSGIFQFIGIDSLKALQSEEEAAKDIGDRSRAPLANMLGPFAKKMYTVDTDTTIYAINQISQKQDATNPYQRKWENPGGKAKDHLAFNIIYLSKGENIKKKIKGEDVVIGKYINFLFEKGKFGTHEGIIGSFPYIFDDETFGVNKYLDLVEVAMQYNLIIKERGDAYTMNHPLIAVPGEKLDMETLTDILKKDDNYNKLLYDIFKKEKIIFHVK